MDELYATLGSLSPESPPSLFELLSLDSLGALLRPAALYVLSTVAETYPSRLLLRLHSAFDPTYSALHALVELYYLRTWRGSFCEHFYGLKRVPVTDKNHSYVPYSSLNAPHLAWTRSRPAKHLFLIVLWPLLQSKAQEAFDKWNTQSVTATLFFGNPSSTSTNTRPSKRDQLKALFVRLYPHAKGALSALRFVYTLRYMFQLSPFYSPELHLAGCELKRLQPEDFRAYEDRLAARSRRQTLALAQDPSFYRVIYIRSQAIIYKLLEFLKTALPASMFLYQSLDWWFSSDTYKKSLLKPIPPPPPMPKPHAKGIALPKDAAICPLCLQKRTNATLLVNSGFVFCYPCIHAALASEARCPVSWIPVRVAPEKALRRLYDIVA